MVEYPIINEASVRKKMRQMRRARVMSYFRWTLYVPIIILTFLKKCTKSSKKRLEYGLAIHKYMLLKGVNHG